MNSVLVLCSVACVLCGVGEGILYRRRRHYEHSAPAALYVLAVAIGLLGLLAGVVMVTFDALYTFAAIGIMYASFLITSYGPQSRL